MKAESGLRRVQKSSAEGTVARDVLEIGGGKRVDAAAHPLAAAAGSLMALAVVPGAGPTATPSLASSDGPLQPPPDIKNIVDKTAQFVARNGPEFEQRILSDNEKKQNPKFAFLQASDPFHAYYVAKVQELGGTTTLAPAAGAAPAAAVAAPGAGQVSADATVAASKKKKAPSVTPLEPARPMHTVPKPPGAQPLDLDVIQLTAQFVARNGRTFLTGIANREARNPQFDFLKPTHHLFSYFTSLVDAYSKCLMPPEELRARLARDAAEPSRTLARIQQHAAWLRGREKERISKETAEDMERRAQLLIDWHDFVVVETIGAPRAILRRAILRRAIRRAILGRATRRAIL
jgi:splicing factor 3A subunit 1